MLLLWMGLEYVVTQFFSEGKSDYENFFSLLVVL